MNDDHDLDRLVATAASVRDEWLGEADLRDAENELMEEIMATGSAPVTTLPPRPTTTEVLPIEAPLPLRRASHLPGRTRRSRVAVAVGLVAAAAVGVVLVRSTAGDDERGGVAAADTIAPMIVDPVPEGFSVTIAQPAEGPDPQPAQSDERTDLLVYGELSATALTNDVVIGVTVLADAPYVPKYDEAVTVRGRSGSRCSPGANVCPFGTDMTGIEWRQGPGLVITVMSRAFDGDQLLAIAEGLVVEGDTAVLGDVPDGVTTPPQVATLEPPLVPAYAVDYSSPDGTRTISVTTDPESPALRIYSLWRWGARDDTVQGHRATFADLGGGAYFMTWEPIPGQLTAIQTNGIDEADVRALAETVRPATSAEWAEAQRLAAANPSDGEPPYLPPPPGAAERVLADGMTEVRGWRTDDGELCYEYGNSGQDEAPTEFCEDSNQGTTALGLVAIGSGNGRPMVAPAVVGVAPEGTVSIDGGDVTFGDEVDGSRLFVWELPTGEMPTSLTFRNADGGEISTAEVVVYE